MDWTPPSGTSDTMEDAIMSTATIVPQPAPSLYHTDYPAFADALRAVAPELFTTAENYRAPPSMG